MTTMTGGKMKHGQGIRAVLLGTTFLSGLMASQALAANPGPFIQQVTPPGNPMGLRLEDSSRDGSTVLVSAMNMMTYSMNYYVVTIGGVTTAVTLPADASRSFPTVSGMTPLGSIIYGKAYYQSGNTNTERLFTLDANGQFLEYAPANADNLQLTGSDARGTAFAGTYRMVLNNGLYHSFVWRPQTNTFIDIEGLEGPSSTGYASAISGDGSTVIGSGAYQGITRSFRWTSTGGTQLLGTLGEQNTAKLVSSDGNVVAGTFRFRSPGGAPTYYSYGSYRWTQAGGMQSIGTLGATYGYDSETVTTINAMNESGSVLVGGSYLSNANNAYHAFRWTTTNGGTMQDLGTPNNSGTSEANDVSEDGKTVVGKHTFNNADSAFYWTEANGMKTVDQALRDVGVSLPTDVTASATGVSADGKIVTGMTKGTQNTNPQIFFARLASPAPAPAQNAPVNPAQPVAGIITQQALVQSLTTSHQPQQTFDSSQINIVFNGVGGLPMRNTLEPGKRSFWSTLDTGYTDRGGAEGGFGLGEIGVAAGLEGNMTARMALSGTYADLNLENDGSLINRGFYLAPDLTAPLLDDLYLTVGGVYGAGKMDITRGYMNGASLDFSTGEADTTTYGAKIRLDWLNAASFGETGITPYLALNYAHFTRDAYTETGGSFPASYDRSENDMTVARLGVDAVHPLSDDIRLLARAEADYRFEDASNSATGSVIGIGAFTVSGQDLQQFWLRGAIGGEFDMAGGPASVTLNATTNGAEPNLWLRTSWRKEF